MAYCIRYVCSQCSRSIEAWDERHGYYFDEGGKKIYAYHPNDAEVARCVEYETDHLCLACGAEVRVDSKDPQRKQCCTKCNSRALVDTYELEGVACPSCVGGIFKKDPDWWAVS